MHDYAKHIALLDHRQIDRIETMWQRLVDANAGHSPYFADLYGTFTFAVRKGFLQEKVDSGSKVLTWVAVGPQGEDVGFCTINYRRESGAGEIEMLYVDPAHRGHGLGSALMETALARFQQEGITDLKLCVTYGNGDALRLYQRFGFFPFTIDCLYRPEKNRQE